MAGPISTSTSYRIDALRAPLLICWQLTRECDLCCLHCCTESAPGKRLPDELDAGAAERLADQIIRAQVPYVMLCGGEPLLVPHFFRLAEQLGQAGVQLKIETNGQRFDGGAAERLAALPVRSVQVSLDADSSEVYRAQRPGGSLEKALAACRAVRTAGLPLEVTFAPTRINIDQAQAVIEQAAALGAFRLNTGKLMRIGTAARLWARLQPEAAQYRGFLAVLRRYSALRTAGDMQLCYEPFAVEDALQDCLEEPPATLLVLPNGAVKVAAALPFCCADLRRDTLAEAWESYRSAWRCEALIRAVRGAISDPSMHAQANAWQVMPMPMSDGSLSKRVEERRWMM